MNKLRFVPGSVLALVWVLFSVAVAMADDPAPTPTPPFVRDPAPGTQWTVTLKYPPETRSGSPTPAAAKAPRIASVQYRCGAKVTVVQILDESGASFSEGYVVGNRMFKLLASGKATVQQTDDVNYASPFFVHGFLGTAWIGADTYQKTETLGKDLCYKYRKAALVVKEGEDGFSHPELFAWIRVKDNLPLAVAIGQVTYTFSDISPSPGEPALPPAVMKLMELIEKQNRALEAMRRNSR